jgi:hypothetical protein
MADELEKIKKIIDGDERNITQEYNVASSGGINLDNSIAQIAKGTLTYALNASIENFDANSISYQNEPGNELCLNFPKEYRLIGTHFINEQSKHIFFLCNSDTEDSEIGYMDNNDCLYHTLVNAKCLNFKINHPIHKVVHKITNCSTEIYWTDGFNSRRYLNIEDIPYILTPNSDLCDPTFTKELDCNQLKIQPNFQIPELSINDVVNGGDLIAGTYQFAIQYCNAIGDGYTSYYSVTNPTPIANTQIVTLNFNYPVNRSIVIDIANLDVSGYFQYYNLAVIKTINDISSVELVGTFFISDSSNQITYTGQNVTLIRLAIADIFEKFPYYDIAQDVTAVQDILIWDQLTSIDRINYQQIANQIQLQWQTYKIPATEDYADELNATNLRGYLRDEVYAFEIVFLLKNGKQTDGFHIPGRAMNQNENFPAVPTTNPDFIGNPEYYIGTTGYSPYWKIYNTGSVIGTNPNYVPNDLTYKGVYQYGEFAYWESKDVYPCNQELWGDLSEQPIRHHKFPDVLISPVFESAIPIIVSGKYNVEMQISNAVFPIGVNIDITNLITLISNSNLTQDQKDNIASFKIIRGNRGTNKSIIAKGILRNVGKYEKDKTSYFYPNYPYNDVRPDPFILNKSNSFTTNLTLTSGEGNICRSFTITTLTASIITYIDCDTSKVEQLQIAANTSVTQCSLDYPSPKIISGDAFIVCNTYIRYKVTAQGGNFKWTPANIVGNSTFTNFQSALTYPSWTLPHGNPPSPYLTWVAFCLANPTDGACTACLNPNKNVYMSGYNTLGQYLGLSYYLDSLVLPTFNNYGSSVATIEIVSYIGYDLCSPNPLDGFNYPDKGYRQVFNSPETSFGQPFLGDVLKLENVMYGAGSADFVKVKKEAQYKLLSVEAQQDAITASGNIAATPFPFNASVFFAAYQTYLQIWINGINRINFAYSFNSIGNYGYSDVINNNLGIKQRNITNAQYLIPGVQSVGDDFNINNFQRESSVYIKTDVGTTLSPISALPYPNETPSLVNGVESFISDESRFTISEKLNCFNPERETPIKVVAYYASIKDTIVNQWGQIYSYETLDTGFQKNIESYTGPTISTIFGGDTFICKFGFKTKLPFFIDNRVNAPDDSDVFYDEIGNVAYPKYWHSARSQFATPVNVSSYTLTNFIAFKAHNFDCPNSQTSSTNGVVNPGRNFYDGYFYLFAYGVPNFYVESSYNVNLRQAFNNKEGEFWPHVTKSIPNDWVQESFVPIVQDNTYYYNITYSKQNKENYFSHLPVDWKSQLCFTNYPFRAVYSDRQQNDPTNKSNTWLTYRAISFFDFPQNYGNLISLDGIQNRAVLARFENKSLLYNTMLTINTSNPQAAYIGNDTLFKSAPPIDFAETDLGYVGSQNKFLLKIPQGQITIDAKRGQVFLISGNQVTDLSMFGSGMNRFFTDHLAFEILRYFPDVQIIVNGERVVIKGVDTDNHFNGFGLHGVYDSKYDRVIITKIDYIPINSDVKYDSITREFYINNIYPQNSITTTTTTTTPTITTTDTTTRPPLIFREIVYVTDDKYFCNKSWTLSFNLNINKWTSFHSYIPNFYIAENNFFYSGLNDCCADFDAIIGGVPLEPTTTTTTSTSSTTTTSTTTIAPFVKDCDLEGEGVQQDCDLEGEAEEIPNVTTTTTTTAL